MSSENLHEPREVLSPGVVDTHRAIVSLMEELEAVDWYNQRAAACTDSELRQILEHNRDEEKEHAAMLLEWLRRHDPGFDHELRTYLFTEGSILDVEDEAMGRSAEPASGGQAPSTAAHGSDVGGIDLGELRGRENT